MKSERPLSPRFSMALVLSMMCLTSSACSNSKPAVDTSQNDRARGLAVEKGEAKKIIVKNNSATMYQHKKFYITLSSGPVGSAGIPTAISLGDTVFVKGQDKELTAKHIFWTRHLERAEWQGKILAEAGSVTCVIVQTLYDLPDNDEDRWGDKLWIHVSDCEVLE
jgi:hypothetical protein